MPAASPTVPISKLMELKADAVSYRERLSTEDVNRFTSLAELAEWVKAELGLNLAPMFESAVDAINQDVVVDLHELADAVEDMETEDQLTEETSTQILTVFEQGRAVCNLLEAIAKNMDAVTRKRVAQAVKVYRTSETAVRDVVVGITMLPDDVGEAGDEGGDDEEKTGDGGQADQTEPAGEPAAAIGEE